ncbi:MAG: DUF2490 domain-containing protein [Flavobacteriales bacterium]|nr:DUF2490 domain-containing protein [Flavobacteriales bacterium]
MRTANVVLALGLALSTSAQDVTSFGLFPTIDHSGDLSKRWSYNVYLFDAIKTGDDGSANATVPNGSFYAYAELGATYKLAERWSATVAYVHERQFPFEPTQRMENRAFQQITWKRPFGRTAVKFRARFDERWIRTYDAEQATFSSRLRLLAGLKYPNDTRTYLTGYFEGFLTTSDDFSYDETWATAQVGFKLNENHALETGVLFIDWRMPYGWMHQAYMQLTWVSTLGPRDRPQGH